MSMFVRVAAVLVGLANATVYNLVGDSPLGGPIELGLEPWPQTTLYMLSAVVAGLAVSSMLIGFARRELRGSFFARYGLMVLAVCLGGVVLGCFLTIVAVSFTSPPITVADRFSEALSALPFIAVAGGVLGAVEGVVLAFPLAAMLGLFLNRSRSSGERSTLMPQ